MVTSTPASFGKFNGGVPWQKINSGAKKIAVRKKHSFFIVI
jgi:hypothetical protein